MPDNPRYRSGAIWRTRTTIKAYLDAETSNERKMFAVPRNEYVIVLVYTMSRNYREDVAFLWDGRVVFAFDIDSAYQFDTDPRGFNTETNVSS